MGARLTNERSVSTILPRQLSHAPLEERLTYGEPWDFPALRHEPVNEQGVVLLFGMVANIWATWSNPFKPVSPIARRTPVAPGAGNA